MSGSGFDDGFGLDYSQLIMREVTPQRSVGPESFSQGSIQYDFSLGKPISALLNRSYFRVGVRVSALHGAAFERPLMSDRLALSPYSCDNLFSNISFQIQQQDVSTVVSYAPQTAAVRRRLKNSESFNKSLSGVMGNGDSFAARQRRITGDSLLTPELDDVETLRLSTLRDAATTCAIAVSDADDATVGIATVTGVNTTFTTIGAAPGDYLVIKGRSYEIGAIASATSITLNGRYSAGAVAAATSDAYIVKRKSSNLRPDERSQDFYMIWQPALGVFGGEMGRKPLPHAGYRMILSPNSDYGTSFLQSLNSGLTAADGTGVYAPPDPSKFKVEITSLNFYLATIAKPVLEYSPKILSEFNVQSKRLDSQSAVLNFVVPVSCNAIAVWLQDAGNGKDAAFPPTLFKCRGSIEQRVNNLQITYANQTKSPVPFTSDFDNTPGGGDAVETKKYINKLQQRYLETMSEAGWLDDDGKLGAPEDFRSWLNNGALYFASFIKGTNDPSVDVQVSINMATALPATANCNLYIAAFYSRVVEVALEDGNVKAVATKYE